MDMRTGWIRGRSSNAPADISLVSFNAPDFLGSGFRQDSSWPDSRDFFTHNSTDKSSYG